MKIMLMLLPFLIPSMLFAQSNTVKGYTKKSGAYVAPHKRKKPDKSKWDNYSTKGNVNPYTGKKGTKKPYK